MRANTSAPWSAWLLALLLLLGAIEAAAPAALAQAACASDECCPSDQYCNASGSCAPRCDAAGLCVGPPAATSLALASDGEHVCFAGAQAGEVWSWDGSAAPARRIGSTTGLKALLVADGYCYFAGDTLARAPLAGGAQESVHGAAPKRAFVGPEHVWWTVPVEQGLEVWRTPRAGALAAERFALAAANQNWEAASSAQLFRRVQGSRACDLVSAPLEDLTAESALRMTYSWSCGGDLQTDAQGVFFNQYSGTSYQLHRVDFASPAEQINTGVSSTDYGPVRFLLNGAWIFAARVENPAPGNLYPVTFYRLPKRLAAPAKEQLYRAPAGTPNTRAMQFAVLGSALVFVTREGRLVTQSLAPLPCAPELPCPEGYGACGADLVCE